MSFQTSHPLASLTTLRLPATAAHFVILKHPDQLPDIADYIQQHDIPFMVLGEGSNTLFQSDYPGLVILNQLSGKQIKDTTGDTATIEVAAGENWHQLVSWTVDQGFGGIENLALIPGTAGAAPVQNIAAYGQNFADVFESLTAYDLATKQFITMDKAACEFGYRDSYFRHTKHALIITSITLKLSTHHQLQTDYYSIGVKYESITQELQSIAAPPYTINHVYQAVINIRTRQLPDWHTVPTAGSFFKNPLISKQKLAELQTKIPELQYYPADNLNYKQRNDPAFEESDMVKIPAGRILDHLGWRGKHIGHVSTWDKHALIVTHDGHATGAQVVEYIEAMQADCKQKLDIDLQPEVFIV